MAVSTRRRMAKAEESAEQTVPQSAPQTGSLTVSPAPVLNTVFVVPREKLPKEYGTSVRQTEFEVVARAVAQMCGGIFRRGDSCFYVRLPDRPGDIEWCDKHILRRYYLDNPKGDIAIANLADKITEDVVGQDCAGMVGYLLIEKILKSRIMAYDRFTED